MSRRTDPPFDVRHVARAPSGPQRSGVPPRAHPRPPRAPVFPRRPLQQLLDEPGTAVVRGGRDSGGATQTFLLVPRGAEAPRLALKVSRTASGDVDVEREARMLVEIRRLEIGALRATVPRFVQLCEHGERVVLVASALPGRSLVGAFCGAAALSHRRCHPVELAAAGAWLARFQEATARSPGPLEMLSPDLLSGLDRWARDCDGSGDVGRDALTVAARARDLQEMLVRLEGPRTAVHGDFRASRLLADGEARAVSGVLGWGSATTLGEPLVDLGRFAVTHPTDRARRRATPGAAVLCGRGAQAEQARRFIRQGLTRLGLPESLGYPVAWAATVSLLADPGAGLDRRGATDVTRLLARTPAPTAAT